MGLARYIAVEGAIGVGKTSLAKLLADRFRAGLELEDSASNPFLKDFYRDPKRCAFKTQIFFLLSRHQRLQELLQLDLFNRGLVADYLFAKDRLFAHLNLDEEEIGLYERLYQILDPRLVKPDLVIYLKAETELIISRVRGRNREYERGMREEYLERVNRAYNRYFSKYDETPLLVVDAGEVDLAASPEWADRIAREIESLN